VCEAQCGGSGKLAKRNHDAIFPLFLLFAATLPCSCLPQDRFEACGPCVVGVVCAGRGKTCKVCLLCVCWGGPLDPERGACR
jgi:hypothetical protein